MENIIYTSYFYNYRHNYSKKYEGISIALHTKNTLFDGESYLALAPTPQILFKFKNYPLYGEKEYTRDYAEQVLNKLDAYTVGKELCGKVLLCYENKEKFCHRHIVAEWLRTKGFTVVELD